VAICPILVFLGVPLRSLWLKLLQLVLPIAICGYLPIANCCFSASFVVNAFAVGFANVFAATC
jgi:hypothetical protein